MYVFELVFCFFPYIYPGMGFPCGSAGKESAYNEEDMGSIPGSGRFPVEGKGYPQQYSCLENHMDRGAWKAPRVAKLIVLQRVGHLCLLKNFIFLYRFQFVFSFL